MHDEAAAFAKAKAEHKGVMIDFGATWCNPCERARAHVRRRRRLRGDQRQLRAAQVRRHRTTTPTNDARKAKYDAGNLPAVRYLTADRKAVGKVDRVVAPAEMMTILTPAIEA